MRKRRGFLLAAALLVMLTACGKETGSGAPGSGSGDSSDQLDLTKLSSTMVYSEVYNMMTTPQDYVGKTVTMRGQFAIYQGETPDKVYYAVIIPDATACCSQGLEFVLAGEDTYPEGYPEEGQELTVTGEFQTYEEEGQTYCHLVEASMEECP